MRSHQGDAVFDETQYQRLRTIAGSVNDTARMAGATLPLFLLVTFYLALTLGASTDENLLRNGQIELLFPQTNIGISVVQSYIFIPLIFLFLHAHTLFMLSVLARKVRTFEAALKMELSHWRFSTNDARLQESECRDWLSAFAFVQIFQWDVGESIMARGLTWIATSAIPLTLLFIIDISFIRYQSYTITWFHHLIFLLDLGMVALFHWNIFGQRKMKIPKRIETQVKGLGVAAMVLFLLFAVHPPSEDENPQTIGGNGESIYYKEPLVSLFGAHNLLDIGPCKAWKIGCRYLDVSNLEATKNKKLRLAGRSLRYARFESAQMQGADFREASLQGAIFHNAKLQEADFSGQKQLLVAQFRGADMQGAKLQHTKWQRVDSRGMKLQRANFRKMKLQGADFQGADLQGANFRGMELEGANFGSALLQGANFEDAELQGAEFRFARLQGANFEAAKLQGANFRFARLQGANFEAAELQGVDLISARLQCSSGEPRKWSLAWMRRASFDSTDSGKWWKTSCSPLPEKLDQCLQKMIPDKITSIKPAWGESKTLKDHMRRRLVDCPKQVFGGAKPKKEDMVFYDGSAREGPLKGWPAPANTKDPSYLRAWREWTVEFACRNVHTARSSVRRWRHDTLRFEKNVSNDARPAIFKALIKKRNDKKNCPGIAAIPNDEWERLKKAAR